jgi:hypothetical protein
MPTAAQASDVEVVMGIQDKQQHLLPSLSLQISGRHRPDINPRATSLESFPDAGIEAFLAAGDAAKGEDVAPFFEPSRHKKTGPGTPGPNPVLTGSGTTFPQCLNKRPAYLQIIAIVLHHLGPCRDEVIDERVIRIIGSVDFSNGTQFRV